jgi:hypothetical protein
MRVTETIHHGDYRNVRTENIEPTFAAFLTFLQASPYKTMNADSRYLKTAFSNLLTTGRGEFGWATYTQEDI